MSPTAPETINQHRYPNGLVLVAESMPGVQSAAFTLLIPAGAAYEAAEGLGLGGGAATMTAEWIVRGAGDRDSRELLSALDNLGVNHGESAQTLHTSLSAATLARNLIPALEIFADVVLRPRLEEEEVEPIRALCVQNLRSLEDDPGTKVIYELRRRHFPDPWGRPSPGTVEGVSGLSGDDLRRFHRATYRPNGAILGVAGAIDWPRLRDAVGRLFGDWEPRPDPTLKEQPAGPRRDHIVRETQQIQIALAFPSDVVTSPDYYKARAAVAVLGGYSSARLFTEVREKRGLCYSVYSTYESQRDRAAILCHAGTSTDRAQQTLDVMSEELRRLARDGIQPEELETMRAGLKSSLIMAQESSMSRSSGLASDWYFLHRVRPIEEISAELDRLTPESVSEYAAGFPGTEGLTMLTLGPAPLQWPR
ncbi:Peptidase M16 inactive domain protein [Aquisphaera giovannonii]|uniref:Peptidase M16 inactive domain protein n=1 Tax=Aquisphaera giovannonii TaxID=406548 RepID=A0A5B9VWC0_9BACT|nr:pitrilysin family protein [Aquisphaera giovannonii]QEH32673.1 Peptidase M16 inactive domain protein [Aquisphaera giovannonii]